MKKTIIYILFLVSVLGLSAQNEFDVLRYSMLDYSGDARFNAMGGSFGALGANMSALSVNPGGLGVYKSSDISFTTAFNYSATKSKYNNKSLNDGRLAFNIGNLGFVANMDGRGDWESASLSIGYNRTNNYNNSITIKSETDTSLLSIYVNELNANGGTYDGDIENLFLFSSNLPYQAFLVNPLLTDSMQYNHVFELSNNIKQVTTYQTKGGSGEVYVAYGANYSDRLYIGGLIGFPVIRYAFDRNYTESVEDSDTLAQAKSYSIHDYVKTNGSGINFKLGMIYKIAKWFRVGAAFHTPTFLSLTDNYEKTIRSELKDGTTYEYSSPYGLYDYQITTPYRIITSASFVLGSKGVINGDFEIVDYSSAHINSENSEGYDFTSENQNISSNFNTSYNVRVGTEWRLDPFRLRAGYRFSGNELKKDFSEDYSSSTYSVGAGIKKEEYYFDMSYSLKRYKRQAAIVAQFDDFSEVDINNHYLTFTLGFRF